MTRWSRWRKRALACTFLLVGAWNSGACGKSESGEAGDDEAGGGTAGAGGTRGGSSGSGGTSGVAFCDAPYCNNGFLSWGPCPGPGFAMCDRSTSGVDCVTSGVCPIGDGGTGGAGGAGGVGGRGGASGAGSGGRAGTGGGACDGVYCDDGAIRLGPCPGMQFTVCDRAESGVDCVVSGPCPGGAGGAGGEGGA